MLAFHSFGFQLTVDTPGAVTIIHESCFLLYFIPDVLCYAYSSHSKLEKRWEETGPLV